MSRYGLFKVFMKFGEQWRAVGEYRASDENAAMRIAVAAGYRGQLRVMSVSRSCFSLAA